MRMLNVRCHNILSFRATPIHIQAFVIAYTKKSPGKNIFIWRIEIAIDAQDVYSTRRQADALAAINFDLTKIFVFSEIYLVVIASEEEAEKKRTPKLITLLNDVNERVHWAVDVMGHIVTVARLFWYLINVRHAVDLMKRLFSYL